MGTPDTNVIESHDVDIGYSNSFDSVVLDEKEQSKTSPSNSNACVAWGPKMAKGSAHSTLLAKNPWSRSTTN